MKVELRKVRDFGQGVEVERLIQMLINVGDDPMHTALVFRAAVSRSHALSTRAQRHHFFEHHLRDADQVAHQLFFNFQVALILSNIPSLVAKRQYSPLFRRDAQRFP